MENTVSISLSSVSKKFNKEWIFKEINLQINPGSKWVILGSNGSGKSTLLQVISGFLIPDKGTISYQANGNNIKIEEVNDLISFASPYIQLSEDLTLTEYIEHIALFKPFQKNISTKELMDIFELKHAAKKAIKHFSSGMKQRTKLGMAIMANAPVLFLDEPLSNLDANGINWYKQLIKDQASHKTIIVCSNAIKDEYGFCEKELNMSDYKTN
ncbi:MAG: ATP-binding cassette domain-containing protein [Sphingobacteriaceae bacterium]